MFSRFICVNFIKKGKCTDPSCKLKHVKDIGIFDESSEPSKKDFKPK